VGCGFGIAAVVRWVQGLRGRGAGAAGAALGVAASLLVGAAALAARGRWFGGAAPRDWRQVAYRAAGEWLAANSAPAASVAGDEIGILGFYGQRRVLDLIGLVSPGARPYAAAGDPVGAFLAAPTEYVVFHTFDQRGATRPIVSRPWFPGAYAEAVRLDFPEEGGSVVLFARRPDAQLPPARPPRPPRPPRSPPPGRGA
jgi:hypothetical protein